MRNIQKISVEELIIFISQDSRDGNRRIKGNDQCFSLNEDGF
jgi:hypothetical protein